MKILIVSRGNPISGGGILGIFEFDQAKALAAAGHEVILLCIDLRSIRRKRKLGLTKFSKDNVTIYNYAFPLGRVPRCILRFVGGRIYKRFTKRIIKETGRPDYIHAHFALEQGYYAYKFKNYFKIPYVVTEHSSKIGRDIVSKGDRKVLSKIYKNSLINITVSEPFKKFLSKKYNCEFEVAQNIVDASAFSFINHSKQDECFHFVAAGTLCARKGYDVLINAFANLIKNNINADLTIIGGGEDYTKLSKLTYSLKLSDKVKLVGPQKRDAINEIYSKSDCFILTSRFETFGVVYIEAMYTGLPVIATICGGPESFVNEKCGYLVDTDNIEQTTDKMMEMIQNYAQFDSKFLHNYAKNNFSPEVVANKIIEEVNKKLKL